ncbi:MAG TPA: hypothetical protein VGN90_10295 [Pyrinomonadaceae bacterium]|jgi:hypothetical protein|nr:hypothetical protein [Pyrinomonadaceae bacterium]
MATNITEQRYSDDELQLAEPHFDEEATMLSARPVVPLTEIAENDARAGFKRHLGLGLSLVASLILGVVGATLILRQRVQKPAAEIVETAIAGSGGPADHSALSSFGEVTGEVAGSRDAVETAADKNGQLQVAAAAERQVSQPVRKPIQKIEPERRSAEPGEFVSPEDEREIRRAERIEARRLRRSEAREERRDRRRGRKSANDLLRVREIFEGSRRP